MGNRFFNGLVFGTGFAIAFLGVLAIAIFVVLPMTITSGVVDRPDSEPLSSQELLYVPPEIKSVKRFLGSIGTYGAEFSHGKNRQLSTGPGRILGAASVNGEPLAGLRLRLALNGSVMSQWAVTDPNGEYEIGVPYGKYRIDGYELNMETADKGLAGKIEGPDNPYSSEASEVSADQTGPGLELKFVDPVQLNIPKKRYSTDEEIVIAWEPYTGATEYSVQVVEKPVPRAAMNTKWMFPWPERPIVLEPEINLSEYLEFKPGYYYTVEVHALKDGWSTISTTGNRHSTYDFEIVE